jgi:hypothetical protein
VIEKAWMRIYLLVSPRGTNVKKLVLLAQALVAWAMLSSAVSATTLNPGDVVSLENGSFYDTDRPSIGANTSINDVFTFTANVASAVYKADGVFDGAVDSFYNVKNLTLTWFNLTTGTQVAVDQQTNNNAVNTGPNTTTINFALGNIYRLVITGTTGSEGGGYNFQIRSVSAVPLPPAALLLITGIAGAGFMARRRKAKEAAGV